MRTTRNTALIALALSAGSLIAASPVSAADGLQAAGLTSGGTKVTTFSTGDGTAAKQEKLVGLVGDAFLVGIDYRPQDGKLYGVGNSGGLYLVDPKSGAATLKGQLTVSLIGESFAVDFNPAANALRILSDTGQNLRQPFRTVADDVAGNDGTAVDAALNYGGMPVTGTTTSGGTPALGVTGAAYTNNDNDCINPPGTTACTVTNADGTTTAGTGTMLFDIDTVKDQVVLQTPPNNGILAARPQTLGVDTSDVVGFDIYSTIEGGKATTNTAFAILTVAGERGLYSIDTTTGAATFLRSVTRGISDIAIATVQPVA